MLYPSCSGHTIRRREYLRGEVLKYWFIKAENLGAPNKKMNFLAPSLDLLNQKVGRGPGIFLCNSYSLSGTGHTDVSNYSPLGKLIVVCSLVLVSLNLIFYTFQHALEVIFLNGLWALFASFKVDSDDSSFLEACYKTQSVHFAGAGGGHNFTTHRSKY